ncbi:hypothetical protein M758_UG112400 [Ceratodon purpureus]|nr:hypothetical protein M758_UG112400 [Ceratodon purpureus]
MDSPVRGVIDWKQPCSIPWFRIYMRLPAKVVIPSLLREDHTPTLDAVALFFGPMSSEGFTFDAHENQAYEDYVRDLFTRTMQLKWPLDSVLPLQFARALVAEACEMEINWAEFAFMQTHPEHNPPGMPTVLPCLMELSEPLPSLRKIIPVSNFKEVAFSLSAVDTKPEKLEKGKSPPGSMPSPDQKRSSSSAAACDDVKTGYIYPPIPASLAANTQRRSASPRMDSGAVKALNLLKGEVKKVVVREQNRLRTAREEAFEPIAGLAQQVMEENEKLKHVLRKASEKQGNYERAVAEYERSREVVRSVHDEAGAHDNQDLRVDQKKFVKTCERLVNSWKLNVENAKKRVMSWDFKSKRQYMTVSKAHKELAEAEAKYRDQCLEIDSKMENLRGLCSFLSSL